MKFATHNDDPSIDISGTSLKGYLRANYQALVEVFGEPIAGDIEDKVSCEWDVLFDDGTISSIYSWKNYGMDPRDVLNWNIGGRDKNAVARVSEALKNHYHGIQYYWGAA